MRVRDANVWKDSEPWVRDGGIWKPVDTGLVRDAGVWKEFYSSGTPFELVSAHGESSNSLSTMPQHQAGDMLVAFALATGSSVPTLPTGWSNIRTTEAITSLYGVRRARFASKIASSSSESSGVWTGASFLYVHVFRGVLAIGASQDWTNLDSDNKTTLPTLSLTAGSSYVLGHTSSILTSDPSGMLTTGVGRSVLTDGPVSSFASRTATHANGRPLLSCVIELIPEKQG